jgi:SPP1 family predicted phage head-tail adaptor
MPSITTPELDAGKLDRRVTLLRPVYADDDYQDEIADYELVTQVWAAVQPAYGQEMNSAGRTLEIVTTTIQIRYRTDIDARWRIQDGAVVYQIKGMLDVLKRRVQWQLNCVEVE